MQHLGPGAAITLLGTYAINPEHYEVVVETPEPWPLGELMTLAGDPRLWRVVHVDGKIATLRLEMQARSVAILRH